MFPSSSTPWKPAMTAIWPFFRVEKIFEPSIVLMRAFVNASSVRTFTWWPRSERALPPSASIAIDMSADVTCSPVEAMTSISRAFGTAVTSWASLRRRFVSPLIALTMTTTSLPSFCVAIARRATLRMRSTVPTEVPPNFWTTSAKAAEIYGP